MRSVEMEFPKAFPNLALSSEAGELMERARVSRIAVNQAKNRMRVYITSDNWIKKEYIYEVEDAIASQIFDNAGMEVKVVEHFRLSNQYNPKNFYRLYRTSMLLELKQVSPLLHQTFLHVKLDFGKDGQIGVELPDTMISRDREGDIVDYLDKVFAERAGFTNVHFVTSYAGR